MAIRMSASESVVRGQFRFAGPDDLVLYQRVHLGQHSLSRAPVRALGRPGRGPRVGDQAGENAADLRAVLPRGVPQPPRIGGPRRKALHINRRVRRGQHGIPDRIPNGGHRVMRNPGEGRHRDRRGAAQIHVRPRQHGHITDSQRFRQLHQHRQPRWQAPALLDPLQPGRGHADQPGEHRPGQARALAQDLDALTGPLAGEIIEHAHHPTVDPQSTTKAMHPATTAPCRTVTLTTLFKHRMPRNAARSCGQTAVKRSRGPFTTR